MEGIEAEEVVEGEIVVRIADGSQHRVLLPAGVGCPVPTTRAWPQRWSPSCWRAARSCRR